MISDVQEIDFCLFVNRVVQYFFLKQVEEFENVCRDHHTVLILVVNRKTLWLLWM